MVHADSEYLEKLQTQLDVLKSVRGDICSHSGMTEDELTQANIVPGAGMAVEIMTATLWGRQQFEAALFLAKSDQGRYGWLSQKLTNDFNKGWDSYPESISAAYELMLHGMRDQNSRPQSHGNAGMVFNIVGGTGVPATNTQLNPRPGITCDKCGKVGQISGKCAETKHTNGTVLVNTGTVQVPKDSVPVLGADGKASTACR